MMSDNTMVDSMGLASRIGRWRAGDRPEEYHEVNDGVRKEESMSIAGVLEVEVNVNEKTFSKKLA